MLSSTGSPLQENLFHLILGHIPRDFGVIKSCEDALGSILVSLHYNPVNAGKTITVPCALQQSGPMVDLRCKGSVHDVVFDASLQKDTIQGISEDALRPAVH